MITASTCRKFRSTVISSVFVIRLPGLSESSGLIGTPRAVSTADQLA